MSRKGGGVMESRVSRVRALGAACLVALGCGQGVVEQRAAITTPVAPNRAQIAGRTASVAPTLRLPGARAVEPPADAVAARVAPAEVTLRQPREGDPWVLFDGDPTSMLNVADRRVEVSVTHNACAIDGLRLRGPLRASITVLDASATEPSPITGLERVVVDIADGEWKTIAPTHQTSPRTLVVRFEAEGALAVPEIELWGRMSAAHLRPELAWGDLGPGDVPGVVVVGAEARSQRVSTIDRARSEDAGTFALDVASAAACRRAFLRYSLEGAPNSNAVSRSVNGSSPTAAYRPQRVEQGGLQLEEISPSLLRVGRNTVRFDPVSDLGPSGYVVRDLSLLCAVDARFEAGATPREAAALLDGANSSGLSGAARVLSPIAWPYGTAAQTHAVSFRVAAAARGALELSVDGSPRRMRVSLDDRPVGWHDILLPDNWPAGALRIRPLFDRENAGIISEMRVSASPAIADASRVVVTSPLHGECLDNRMLVRGYVTRPVRGEPWRVRVLGVESTTNDEGEFSVEAQIAAGTTDREIEVVASRDEQRLSRFIPLDRCRVSPPASAPSNEDIGAPFGAWVHPGRSATIQAGDVRVEVPSGAVAQSLRVTVRPLAESQVPALDAGLTNVTRGARAYRLGPHPMRFLAALKLTIPVDPSRLGEGQSKHDASIYYYDVGARRWRAVPEDAAQDGDFVAARTDHFTDFIAATSASPEGPQGASGVNNSLGGLGAGSPLAGLDTIAAPTANAQGTASTGLAIRIPAGRQGMQPSLALRYDSSGDNGLLGVGWSMPVSAITVDTRRGVPMYRNGRDSYVSDGQPIVPIEPGCTAAACAYQPRVLGAPVRITRLLSGTTITWTVTDASGRTAHYGAQSNTRLCAPAGATTPTLGAEFGTPVDRCAAWLLEKVTDPFGNFVLYEYDEDSSVPATTEPWTQRYLKTIRYTGHGDPAAPDVSPYYAVEFAYDAVRADVALSGRYGFLTKLRRRLTTISVNADSSLVRRYHLDYRTGDFGKSLLERVRMLGTDGVAQLYQYSFDYHQAERDSAGNLGFGAPRQWTADTSPVSMSGGFSNAGGAAFFGGVGDPFFLFSGGVGVSYQRSGDHNNAMSVDLNGDGLPDLFHRDGRAWINDFRTVASERDRSAGTLKLRTLADVGNELVDQRSDRFSIRGGASGWGGRGVVGGVMGFSWNADTRLFMDVDADGRVDLIHGPETIGGVPVLPVRRNPFAGDRQHFGRVEAGAVTHDYTLGGIVPYERTTTFSMPEEPGLEAALHRTDPLVRWRAPQRGVIQLGGALRVLGPDGDGVVASIYHAGERAGSPMLQLVWQKELSAADGNCVPGIDGGVSKCGGTPLSFEVFNTDRLYFRLHAKNNFDGDVVEWHPQVGFTSYAPCITTDDPDDACQWPPPALETFDRALDFRLADQDQAAFVAAYRGRVQISGSFTNNENVTVRVFRRRQVAPPGVAVPVYEEGTTVVNEAFLNALITAGAITQVEEIYPPGVGPSTPLGPERVFSPGTHTIERTIDVEARDQILVHVQVGAGSDPGATMSAWAVSATQDRVCPAASGGTCYDVTHPCIEQSPAGAMPGTPAPRMCKLVSAPAGQDWLAEDLVYVQTTLPAIHHRFPSGFSGVSLRADALQGWYRGWSVGEWNGDHDLFKEELLQHPLGVGVTVAELVRRRNATPREPMPVPASGPVMPRPNGDDFRLGTDVLHALSGTPLWRGTGVDSFVTATLMKPSSRAPYRVDPTTHRIVPTTTRGASVTQAPSLRAGYAQLPSFNAQVVGVSATHTGGATRNDLDFIDVNGDGYPDSIRWNGSVGSVQLQIPPTAPGTNGSFSAPIPISLPAGRAALSSTDASSTEFSATIASQGGAWWADHDSRGTQYGTRQISASGGAAATFSHRNLDMIDVNGDGLLDHVESVSAMGGVHEYKVAYNLGYAFSPASTLALGDYGEYRTATTAPLDGLEVRQNCTISGQFGAYGVGAGSQFGVSRTRVALADINGDGLPDRVMRRSAAALRPGATKWDVQINLGDHFGPLIPWAVPSWPAGVAGNPFPTVGCAGDALEEVGNDQDMPALLRSWSVDINAGFPILIPAGFVGIQLHPTLSLITHTETSSLVGLNDIDGDGLADHVLKTADNNGIWMRPNPNGRANLLRTITGPTGVVTTLSYAREGNHVTEAGSTVQREMPVNRWVLSAVSVSDPLSQSYESSIDYNESGNYDRAEREFYGFGTVKVTHPDGSFTVTKYHNQDYYRRLTAYETIEYSATGNVLSRAVETFTAPPSLPIVTGAYFVRRSESRVYEYDGTSADIAGFRMQTGSTFEYNVHRLLETRIDQRDAPASDDLRTRIEYYVNSAAHIYRPNSVELFDYMNQSLRKQTITVNPNGSVHRVEQRLVGGRNPATDAPWIGSMGSNPSVTFDYDAFGNVRVRSDLSGYWVEYTFDWQTRSFIESAQDSWGLTTSSTWDRRFGAPLVTTDANGHKREVRFDVFGRVKEVFGAYDYGGTKPTVAYDYTLGNAGHVGPHWSASHTIDTLHPGDTIDAIRFVDGYGRTLQTKRELAVDYPGVGTTLGFSVSGHFVRDSLGRIKTQFQPHFDSIRPLTTLSPSLGLNPSTVDFDDFGRVKVVHAANGTDTLTYVRAYSTDTSGLLRRYSTATFERAGSPSDLRFSATWHDLEGNLRRFTRRNMVAGTLTEVHTNYDYDLLGRLTTVEDHAGRKTTAAYDSLDRMIELNDPDAGSTEYQYLLTGELGARITPELRNAGNKIYYDYTAHRLTRVRYPSTTWTEYEYGAPGAPFNRAGRMWRVTDSSGSRERQFTANGEVSFERTELVAFGSSTAPTVAEMSFEFDSLGRATSVTYPPVSGVSETVRYGYDSGGNLSSVTGDVGGVLRPYIEQLTYDHLGRRKRLTLGNGPVGNRVSTVFTYDDVNERLNGINTNTPFGPIQNLSYSYTAQGLVRSIKNSIGTGADRGPSLQEFEYDHLENLVHATGEFDHDDGSHRRYTLDVSYDDTGRTTQFNQQDELLPAGGGTPIPVAASTRNDTYSYASGHRHQVSSIGTTTYGFDLNGNQRTEKRAGSPTRLFNWDEEDRLSSVEHDGDVTSFLYDAGGTRTHKSGASGTTVYPNAFVSIRNGVAVTRHVYADGQRVSSVLSGDDKERVYWTHGDHQGSTQYTTAQDGAVHEHYEHLPFGESWVEQTSGSDPSAHRFRGRELDQETGLQYVGARYYDPRTTRWLSTDPALAEYMLGDGVGDPRNLSTYAYVFNSPGNYVDPDGRQAVPAQAQAAQRGEVRGDICSRIPGGAVCTFDGETITPRRSVAPAAAQTEGAQSRQGVPAPLDASERLEQTLVNLVRGFDGGSGDRVFDMLNPAQAGWGIGRTLDRIISGNDVATGKNIPMSHRVAEAALAGVQLYLAGRAFRLAGEPASVSQTANGGGRSSVAADAADAATMDGWTESGATVRHSRTATAIGDDLNTISNFERSKGVDGHDVIVHGDRDHFGEFQFRVNGDFTHAQQIADAIHANPHYAGQPINLVTCYGSRGPARELRSILGVEVRSSSTRVDLDPVTGVVREHTPWFD
jgi:RHS repeat-associated protein